MLPTRDQKALLLKAAQEVIERYSLKSELAGKPEFGEHFLKGSMVFNVLGKYHTRNCKVRQKKFHKKPKRPDLNEGKQIARVARKLGLRYVILYPAIRDDLKDQGASYLAHYIREIKKLNPSTVVEVFIPDYGKKHLVKAVLDSSPDVICHNIDTVKRLYPVIKGKKYDYDRSIRTIRMVREFSKRIPVRANLMLGFRENWFEVIGTLRRLRKAGVDIITMGQYYRPSKNHMRVLEYVPEEKFELYEREAYQLGYKRVIAYQDNFKDYLAPATISSLFGI